MLLSNSYLSCSKNKMPSLVCILQTGSKVLSSISVKLVNVGTDIFLAITQRQKDQSKRSFHCAKER